MKALKRPDQPLVSVVVPCFNESESLPELTKRLVKVSKALSEEMEIIYCDDGSRDETWTLIRTLSEKHSEIRGIRLSRNFGHQACLTAGLDKCQGDVIIMMDADLQDPPELIPKMLKKWKGGADIVYAVRKKRRGEGFFKKLTAALFYRILRVCTQISIPVDTGDFRLIDRSALNGLLEMRENSRFLRGMFAWVGYRQEPIYYIRQERFGGETKYPLRKMISFALDALTSFSKMPLRMAVWLGLITALLAMVYAVMVIFDKLSGGTVPGWTSTTASVLFLGAVQLITIGVLGEYVARIFDEVKQRPLYLVKEDTEDQTVIEEVGSKEPS